MRERIKRLLRLGAVALIAALSVAIVLPRMAVTTAEKALSVSLTRNIVRGAPGEYDVLDTPLRPFTYLDTNQIQQPIDNALVPDVLPWNWRMDKAPYVIRVKNDITAGQILEYSRDGSTMTLQPMALEWTNAMDQIQPVAMPTNVTPVVINNAIEWVNGYGLGRSFKWEATPFKLNKTLVINSPANLPVPTLSDPELRLSLIFEPSSDIEVYVNDALWGKKTKIQTFDSIQFKKGDIVLWQFVPLDFWDSTGNRGQSVATLDRKGNSLYISIRVSNTWIQQAVFPIYLDADVTIDSSGYNYLSSLRYGRSGPFFKTPLIGYVFYNNSVQDLEVAKTTDGGQNWSSLGNVWTGTVFSYDCWADWETTGDSGELIHITYIAYGVTDIRYCYFDTSDDTVYGDVQVEDCPDIYNSAGYHNVGITKTRGGNLAISITWYSSGAASHCTFYTSSDGSSWNSKNTPWEGSTTDLVRLYPANLADSNDLWATFWDQSASAISLKTHDDSLNSWSENAIASGFTVQYYTQWWGDIRHSDGNLLLIAWTTVDSTTADLRTWDIASGSSITAKTDVLTDSAESGCCALFIDQTNDDLYAYYFRGGTWTATVDCFYKLSENGGSSWNSESTYREDSADDLRWISVGGMSASKGGRAMAMWFNDDLNDYKVNYNYSVSIAAAGGGFDIANDPSTKAFGIVAASSTYYAKGTPPGNPVADGDCIYTVTNSGDACDLDMKMADFAGGVGWNIAAGAPGSNEVKITTYYSGQDPSSGLVLANTDAEFYDGLASSATIKWDFRMDTGTFTDGVAKSGVLTITAVAED